jgi:hypothetical protein
MKKKKITLIIKINIKKIYKFDVYIILKLYESNLY